MIATPRHAFVLALLSFVAMPGSARAQGRPDALLLRTPDVSATQIVFRFDGDLWLVDKRGGEARRTSATPGNESFPRFSPDGRRVAFMGGYEGGSDLYVLDVAGGVPQRLTHHPANEVLCDWLPGGEGLIFFSNMVSGQARAAKLFTVPTEGGQLSELPVPFGSFGALDASETWLAYTPYAYSEFATWRRYQGGSAQDVWLLHLGSKESHRLTDWPGTDAQPMWHGREVFFVSDRGAEDRLNLWSCNLDSGAFVQRTNFREFDVRFPSVGPDDIVFENGGSLWRYEFGSGQSVAVPISVPADLARLSPRTLDVQSSLAGIDLGPTAVRALIEARGELFSVPVERGVTRNLTQSDGAAERGGAWSPDGVWIAYASDASGEYEICVRRSDGRPFRWQGAGEEVSEKQLTHIGPGWKSNLSWAPDGKSLAFSTNDGVLHRLVLASGAVTDLATNPDGEPLDVDWSPDSRWLVYSHRGERSRLGVIYALELETGARHALTSGLFQDDTPTFDRDGKWLYFRSQRQFEPSYDSFGDTWIYANGSVVMAVPLATGVTNPFAARSSDEGASAPNGSEKTDKTTEDGAAQDGVATKDEASKSEAGKADAAAAADEVPKTNFEVEGFEAREIQLPIAAGNLVQLSGGKGRVLYVRLPRTGSVPGGSAGDDEEGPGGGGALMMFELSQDEKKREEATLIDGVGGYQLARKADKVGVRLAAGGFAVVDLAPGQKADRKLDLSGLAMTIDPKREWHQLVADAGRMMRDYFYDPHMHRVDWTAVVARTQRAVDWATSRDDVFYLTGEMIAQLNVGHAYNVPPPQGMEGAPQARAAGLVGCDWSFERGHYRIARILGGEPSEAEARGPLGAVGLDARAGDWLLAVDGVPVDPSQDVYAAFLGTAGRTTELTLNAEPTFDGKERRVLVVPVPSESELRYRDWVARNRALVAERSGGRIGYVHVPDTGLHGQTELVRQFLGQFGCDALLVDERWNGGGQVPTRFIELLNRPSTNSWALRHGEDWRWPPVAQFGPKAMLINYASGSGGDCFPYFFRQAGLGKLIGTRTWGGLVGLSGNPPLIDGGAITVPRFAFYENDGTWGVEGFGVPPDLEIVEDPAQMQDGRDPQLLAGIEHLLAELAAHPPQRPQRPSYPDRSGRGIPAGER